MSRAAERPAPAAETGSRARDGLRTGAHRRRQIDSRRVQRGRQAEHADRDDRDGKRERQYGWTQPASHDARCRAAGRERDQPPACSARDQQTGGGAHDREHRGLGQQLADEATPVRAEGQPHRHLPAASDRAREKQIRDVGADDPEQERHADHQRHERRFERLTDSGKTLGARGHVHLGMIGVQLRGDLRVDVRENAPHDERPQLGPRLCRRDARLEAAEQQQPARERVAQHAASAGASRRASPAESRGRPVARRCRR